MNARLCIRLGIGLAISFICSIALAVVIVKAVQRGILPIYTMEAWWWLGKYFALALAHAIPYEWIHGSPDSETYWPAMSSLSFVVLCSVAIWTAVIFGLGLGLSRYVWPKLARRPNYLMQPTGRERPAADQER
jgi:hypothetical protein